MLIESKGRHFFTQQVDDTTSGWRTLRLIESGPDLLALEVVYSRQERTFSLTGFGWNIPLEVAEKFLAEAREVLTPKAAPAAVAPRKANHLRSVFLGAGPKR